MIGMVLRLDVPSVAGLLIFGCCLFGAGWVFRGEHDLWLRSPAGRRRWAKAQKRRRGGFIGRTPW